MKSESPVLPNEEATAEGVGAKTKIQQGRFFRNISGCVKDFFEAGLRPLADMNDTAGQFRNLSLRDSHLNQKINESIHP